MYSYYSIEGSGKPVDNNSTKAHARKAWIPKSEYLARA